MTTKSNVSMAVLTTSALPVKHALFGVHFAVISVGARHHV